MLGTVSLASWDEAAVPYSALCFAPRVEASDKVKGCGEAAEAACLPATEVLASGSTAALTALPPVQALLLWILPA